ncbi:hypothetical protein CAOG_00318 [Capsaspora owczarzaki ATCC 30864]|uniref:Isopenicillin N synthase-like Fe(2+) 2OG dioxygenase domain-containing protein n=1 Tax=Capsaspora owczarzaki (strain ATCC 30864) TaxID=595528 RepID=A0A0D2WIC6_CAPO3|nr:hypothetical protein CAOG_00318 [Capsaspora owczarzaki ATCC 30864]KJE88723.1 hypothetical protein CAOG_000318 [Capsaspora owczarzaki ATCC 30864]|eukprot:XP_004365189.1 hypothetical protein CAOG_00318 [Capsaspora owczarzaki ATCC 30864]
MEVPVINLAPFMSDATSAEAAAECAKAAKALEEFGCLVVRDPRVTEADNSTFLDLMEQYFEQSVEDKKADERPQWGYQVGVTPELVEVPRCTVDPKCLDTIAKMPEDERAHVPVGPDPKWRFFWRLGERPSETKFKELNAEPVVPKAFPQWGQVMNKWGSLMMDAVTSLSEMVAVGFDMPSDIFTKLAKNGPHLLAPTGSDLARYHEKNTIFAGFHTDLNFLTIHGKSRFPGLYVWRRDGKRVDVRVPDGCLLVQAGKQLEWLTGGRVIAGYHEVIVTDRTLEAIERAKAAHRSLWRISSTVFMHIASDNILRPLTEYGFQENAELYPHMLTGDQVARELSALQLKKIDNINQANAAAAAGQVY